jgi:hypothetical protein
MKKVIKKLGGIYKKSEILNGTVIIREELLRGTKEIVKNSNSKRYDHCRISLAIGGMA